MGEEAKPLITTICPLCSHVPGMVIGETAFCTNDACEASFWIMTEKLDDLLMNVRTIQLEGNPDDISE